MLETEKQRRWWFATHPEYSWSRRGPRTPSETKDRGATGVRGYTDQAVTYAKRSVAEAVKSLKQYLGIEEDLGDAFTRFVIEHYPDPGVSGVPRPPMPTPQQLSRWSSGARKEALRTLDRIIPPLAIDEEYVKASRGLWKEFQKRMAEPGPGEWVLVARSPVGLEHQSRMSGSPIIKKDGKYYIYEYKVPNPSGGDPVLYDDYRYEEYHEHKGPMGNLVNTKTQQFDPWCTELERARKQAESQVKAARGRPVIWKVGADQVKAYEKAIGKMPGVTVEPWRG